MGQTDGQFLQNFTRPEKRNFLFWAGCLDLAKNTLNLVWKSDKLIGKNNSPGNFALRDRDFGFTKTPPEHSGSGYQATTGPKSRYIFENPNSEHPRARHDPQSTIFSNFFAENDARTSGKRVGPVLTPTKALKKSKFHKTPKSQKIQIFQPKKGKKRAQSFAGFLNRLQRLLSVSYTHLTLPTICSV